MKLKWNLSDDDIWQIAEIHHKLLHKGFLASFGKDFLYQIYQQINVSNGSTVIALDDASEIVGFIAGGSGLTQVYLRLLKNPLRLSKAILPQLLRKATLLKLFSLITRKLGKMQKR